MPIIILKKALEILPRDPWINRNYGVTQIQQGKNRVPGLKLLLENGRRFPLLYSYPNMTLLEEALEFTRRNLKDGRITKHDLEYLT